MYKDIGENCRELNYQIKAKWVKGTWVWCMGLQTKASHFVLHILVLFDTLKHKYTHTFG